MSRTRAHIENDSVKYEDEYRMVCKDGKTMVVVVTPWARVRIARRGPRTGACGFPWKSRTRRRTRCLARNSTGCARFPCRTAPRPCSLAPTELNQDSVDEIVRLLPVVLILVATTTFLLIFLLTGSLLLPVKALVLNTLSLSATLGALVWVFQEGHLGGVGTTPTGTLVADVLVFLFATAFGLSMDYEVFLLSRIREHWLASPQRSEDNAEAVALGIAGAGRVITAAALLMVIVFVALSTGQVAFMRMIGLGLALAVVVDATLVRMVLVPAVMKLAGRWNWWAPGPLAKLHAKLGLEA